MTPQVLLYVSPFRMGRVVYQVYLDRDNQVFKHRKVGDPSWTDGLPPGWVERNYLS
jgi:hypothetical protein